MVRGTNRAAYDRRILTQKLVARGMTHAEISDFLGVGIDSVHKDVHLNRHRAKRPPDKCTRCGEPNEPLDDFTVQVLRDADEEHEVHLRQGHHYWPLIREGGDKLCRACFMDDAPDVSISDIIQGAYGVSAMGRAQDDALGTSQKSGNLGALLTAAMKREGIMMSRDGWVRGERLTRF